MGLPPTNVGLKISRPEEEEKRFLGHKIFAKIEKIEWKDIC